MEWPVNLAIAEGEVLLPLLLIADEKYTLYGNQLRGRMQSTTTKNNQTNMAIVLPPSFFHQEDVPTSRDNLLGLLRGTLPRASRSMAKNLLHCSNKLQYTSGTWNK